MLIVQAYIRSYLYDRETKTVRNAYFFEFVQVDRELDPRVSNNLLVDYDILCKHVVLTEEYNEAERKANTKAHESKPVSLFDLLLRDYSRDGKATENILHRFLRTTLYGDRSIDQLLLWKTNESSFPEASTLTHKNISDSVVIFSIWIHFLEFWVQGFNRPYSSERWKFARMSIVAVTEPISIASHFLFDLLNTPCKWAHQLSDLCSYSPSISSFQ